MKIIILSVIIIGVAATVVYGSDGRTDRVYLSGTGNDHTVLWNYFCSNGRNSHYWTKIPVPSCWELMGFGTYNYGLDPDSARGKEKGVYRYDFFIPMDWKNRSIDIVFEGSMTDTEVRINGKSAGVVHQGGFYEFRYNISRLLNFGRNNRLEVTVSKESSNVSVNLAERRGDSWVFGGIYRPVYLEAKPILHIESITVDARSEGTLQCKIYISPHGAPLSIEARIFDPLGKQYGPIIQRSLNSNLDTITLNGNFLGIKSWSPELPYLYRLEISLQAKGQVIHIEKQKIGFRTIEVRDMDGIYINGTKIRFKGVCRHSFWPESGRTTSKSISINDVLLIKSMNMNAVRMSHYPPDVHFLDACDSLGLFVLDELGGWQHAYDTAVGRKLVKEMVNRDMNHPSIVFWDNGNEGGWNTALDDEFSKFDIQQREVIHPSGNFRKTDTHHYVDYNFGTNEFFNGDKIFFPTEFLHGLWDGGGGAGLEDFWNLMLSKPRSAGGFLWAFIDESVSRTDKNNLLDSDGNHAPDGILGPHREKEGSYYAIKEIWAPVYFEDRIITSGFNGVLSLENRYDYTNLNQCTFRYQFKSITAQGDSLLTEKTTEEGNIKAPDVLPGCKGKIKIPVNENWNGSEILSITAWDPFQREIYTWTWPVLTASQFLRNDLELSGYETVDTGESEGGVFMTTNGIKINLDKSTGQLIQAESNGTLLSFVHGPVLSEGNAKFQSTGFIKDPNLGIYETDFSGNLKSIRWTMYRSGIVRLTVIYDPDDYQPFYGIDFNYSENKIKSISWLGQGPIRVWKNRLKGTSFDYWTRKYNNTITGQSYDYPEFKGYYSGIYWIRIKNSEKDFSIFTSTDHLFTRLFTPEEPVAGAMNTKMTFPEGNISFLQGISPIGTKTQLPGSLGPQGQLNRYESHNGFLKLELYFDFR